MPARAAAVLIAAAVASLAVAAPAPAAKLVKVGDFREPIYVTAPPADPHRLFVVGKKGQIEVLHDGVRKLFLTVAGDIKAWGVQGLLSMAFAPDYATSGRFYVMYTAPRVGDPDGNVITVAEYRRSADRPNRADPQSKRIVLTIDQPGYSEHNGGQLQFGPDGFLYVAVGDGDDHRDPLNNSQNRAVLLGKLLRIDPRRSGAAPYTVPADNPFAGDPSAAPEVFAYGLRNPWRFSFDRARGDLVVADVGENNREEIDFSPGTSGAGADYGWRCREGTIRTPGVPPCTPSGRYVRPVFEYKHAGTGCTGAITGGYVVRNHDLESLFGRYVYADYCFVSGDIRSLLLGRPHATDDRSTGLRRVNIQSFGEDSCGHLYLATPGGEVDAIVDDSLTPCAETQDVTAPKLEVASDKQQSLSSHRSLYARVRCDEPCGVVASAEIAPPGAGRSFKIVTRRSLGAGRRVRLRLLLTEEAAKATRRSLRSGKRVRARLKIVARDAAGNRAVARKGVRVVL